MGYGWSQELYEKINVETELLTFFWEVLKLVQQVEELEDRSENNP
jgi:hypothetical protein